MYRGGVAELDVCSLQMCAIYDVLMDQTDLSLQCDKLLTMSDWYIVLLLTFFQHVNTSHQKGGVGPVRRILDFVHVEII